MSTTNKVSTTWKIAKSESRRTCTNEGITKMHIKGRIVDNPQIIYDKLNNNCLLIADKSINVSLNSAKPMSCGFSPVLFAEVF